jgi:hypothetical protein
MFDYIQYAYGNRWRYDGKPKANTTAVPISQDQLRSQLRDTTEPLRDTTESKPDGYKNSQASSVRFLPDTNPTAK